VAGGTAFDFGPNTRPKPCPLCAGRKNKRLPLRQIVFYYCEAPPKCEHTPMVDDLRKSVEDLEPPTCEKCHVEMTWYHSQRLLAQPSFISHYFQCPSCKRVKELKTEMKRGGEQKPPRLSAPRRTGRSVAA